VATVGTNFRDILLAMKTRLETRITDEEIFESADSGVVYITNRMNPPALDGKKSLVIVPLYQMVDQKTTEGHGRCGVFKKARVNVYYRHESNLDQTYEDTEWLTGDYGYFQIIEKLEDTFDLWHPNHPVLGNFLLTEPMRLVMNNEPRKNYDDHTKGDGMIELEMLFRAYRTTDDYQSLRAALE
jgi:hypothetical protein